MARVWEVSRARRWQLVFKLPIAYFFFRPDLELPYITQQLKNKVRNKTKEKA